MVSVESFGSADCSHYGCQQKQTRGTATNGDIQITKTNECVNARFCETKTQPVNWAAAANTTVNTTVNTVANTNRVNRVTKTRNLQG